MSETSISFKYLISTMNSKIKECYPESDYITIETSRKFTNAHNCIQMIALSIFNRKNSQQEAHAFIELMSMWENFTPELDDSFLDFIMYMDSLFSSCKQKNIPLYEISYRKFLTMIQDEKDIFFDMPTAFQAKILQDNGSVVSH